MTDEEHGEVKLASEASCLLLCQYHLDKGGSQMIASYAVASLVLLVIMALKARVTAENEVREVEDKGNDDDVSLGVWLGSFAWLWALHGLIQIVLLVVCLLMYGFQWPNLLLLLMPVATPVTYGVTHQLLDRPPLEAKGDSPSA